jgi:hypothetical protein
VPPLVVLKLSPLSGNVSYVVCRDFEKVHLVGVFKIVERAKRLLGYPNPAKSAKSENRIYTKLKLKTVSKFLTDSASPRLELYSGAVSMRADEARVPEPLIC